jgi:hypothetical protein
VDLSTFLLREFLISSTTLGSRARLAGFAIIALKN